MSIDQVVAFVHQSSAEIQSFSDPQLDAYRQTLLQQIDEAKLKLLAVDLEIACRAEA